ncbi:MAG: 23S rRNA (uracil-5-)-methyltransferase RumA, partial [Allobaculum sp.]|nr:23S rRNA (uracil-5-)-methyltransferase RumA [Allobaculum sp.]
MKKNQEFEVTCTDLSDLGFGIAHHDGMTIFVSDLLPEETALIHLLKVQKTYAIGKVIKRLTTSPNRTTPICPKANRCGGCQLMHIQYPAQLQYKEKQLKDLFTNVSKDTKVLPPLGMKEPYFYRNKAQFPIAIKDGKIISGFYKPRSNDIVPVEECFIQSKKINEIYQWLLAHLTLDQAKFLRHLFIR